MTSFALSPAQVYHQLYHGRGKGGRGRTLEPDVEDVRAVRGGRGRLWRRVQLCFADAPLRAEGLVRGHFVDDVDDCLGRGLDGAVRG